MFATLYNYFFPNINDTVFKLDNSERKINAKIEIKHTEVENSQRKGSFATTDIPKGAYIRYRGKFTDKEKDSKIFWWIVEYDNKTGEPIDGGNSIGYIDDSEEDNWMKYINYTVDENKANVYVDQHEDKIYYYMDSNVNVGDEILMLCSQKYFDYINADIE